VAGEDEVRSEVERLRQEVEAARLREIEVAQSELARLRAEVKHYRAEAERNAVIGRRIYVEMQGEVERLKNTIQVLRGSNGRGRQGLR
jgi:HAMP domain-containing protein